MEIQNEQKKDKCFNVAFLIIKMRRVYYSWKLKQGYFTMILPNWALKSFFA